MLMDYLHNQKFKCMDQLSFWFLKLTQICQEVSVPLTVLWGALVAKLKGSRNVNNGKFPCLKDHEKVSSSNVCLD